MLSNSLLCPISQHTMIIPHCKTISADHFVLNKHTVEDEEPQQFVPARLRPTALPFSLNLPAGS